MITKIAIQFLSLVTAIIIARTLGPSGQGIYSLSLLLPSLMISMANIGVSQSTVYYLGQKKYPPKIIFGNNIIISSLMSLIAAWIAIMTIALWGKGLFPGIAKPYLFLGLMLIPCYYMGMNMSSILMGLQSIKKYNNVSLFQNICFLVFIFVFLLVLRYQIRAAIVAQIASLLLAGLLAMVLTKKEIGNPNIRIKYAYLKDTFRFGSIAYIADILSYIHNRVGQYVISIFFDKQFVGIYSIASSVSEKILIISNSAATVLFPKVSSEKASDKIKYITPIVLRYTVLLATMVSLLCLFMSKYIFVLIFSKSFYDSAKPFNILLIGVIALSGSNILACDLLGRGKPIINTYISAASVIINIILCLIMVPKRGIVGAAWAISLAYMIHYVIILIVYSKISHNSIKNVILFKRTDYEVIKQIYKNLILKPNP